MRLFKRSLQSRFKRALKKHQDGLRRTREFEARLPKPRYDDVYWDAMEAQP